MFPLSLDRTRTQGLCHVEGFSIHLQENVQENVHKNMHENVHENVHGQRSSVKDFKKFDDEK